MSPFGFDELGLPVHKALLQNVSPHNVAERVSEIRKAVSAMLGDEPPVVLGPMVGDAAAVCGLPPAVGSLAGIDITPTRRVTKYADPFRAQAHGAFGPTGLEKAEARQTGSLLKSGGRDRDLDTPAHHYEPGQELCHIESGAPCRFLKDNGDGSCRVSYSAGDEADHEYSEVEVAGSNGKATASSVTKRAPSFAIGDEVVLQDGSAGTIAELAVGGLLAIVKTKTGSTMSLTKHLRAAGTLGKVGPMPKGAPVWVKIGDKNVRASVISYNADRVVVQFASGDSAAVDPEMCTLIDERMLIDPLSVLNSESGAYRLIPHGTADGVQAAASASLLKNVKPFIEAITGVDGMSDPMLDTGL